MYTQLVKAFSGKGKVVFMQAPFSVLVHLLLKRTGFRSYASAEDKFPSDANLFTPVIIFHTKIWSKIPFTLSIDAFLLRFQIRRFLDAESDNMKIALWASHPFDYKILKNSDIALRIYDFYDNFSYNEDGSFNKMKDQFNRKLIKTCNLTFATSVTMDSFAKSIGGNSYLIPNGYTLHTNDIAPVSVFPKDSRIIGYIGNIRDWIDFELIRSLINSLGKKQYLAFVGPVSPNVADEVEKLRKYEQFIHIGEVDYSEVFSYISAFSIGIIPFKRNSFTDGVFPNKFFEYVACRIPVVSTDLPDLVMLRDSVNVASSNEDFVTICTAESKDLKFDTGFYDRTISEATWEKRVCTMKNLIDDYLNAKN